MKLKGLYSVPVSSQCSPQNIQLQKEAQTPHAGMFYHDDSQSSTRFSSMSNLNTPKNVYSYKNDRQQTSFSQQFLKPQNSQFGRKSLMLEPIKTKNLQNLDLNIQEAKHQEIQIPEKQSFKYPQRQFTFHQNTNDKPIVDPNKLNEINSPLSPVPIKIDRFLSRSLSKDIFQNENPQQGSQNFFSKRTSNILNIFSSLIHQVDDLNYQKKQEQKIIPPPQKGNKKVKSESYRPQQKYLDRLIDLSFESNGQTKNNGFFKLQSPENDFSPNPSTTRIQMQSEIVSDKNQDSVIELEKNEEKDPKQEIQNQIRMIYQQINQVTQFNSHYSQGETIEHRYLNQVEKSDIIPIQMNIIPIVEKQPSQQKLDVTGYYLNDQTSQILGKSINHYSYSNLKNLRADDTNLTCQGFKDIMINLPPSIQDLSLQRNQFHNRSSYQLLTSILVQNQYENLVHLNLESTNLGDIGCQKVFESVQDNHNLQVLNLSNNMITDQLAIKSIGTCIKNNITLEELYLHFNLIQSKGAIAIAEGLKRNSFLRVLDLSFNNIGSGDQGDQIQGAKALVQSITMNDHSAMLHLDVSYNSIGEEQGREINQILKKNHRIYGLHFQGNCGFVVDPRGFLHFSSKEDLISQAIRRGNTQQRIEGVQKLGHKKFQTSDFQASDVCWLCEGWEEVNFKCKFQGDNLEEPFFIHLIFENFKPTLMYKVSTNSGAKHHEYHVKRMCPPGSKILYFFSSPTKNRTMVNAKQEQANLKDLRRDYFHQLQKDHVSVVFNDNTQMDLAFPFSLNVWYTEKFEKPIYDEYWQLQVESQPRFVEPDYIITAPEIIQWSIPISLFKDWRFDNQSLISSCFQADWNNSKITKIIKSEGDVSRLKKILRHHYEIIKNTYQVEAAKGGLGDVPCVSSNVFTEFIMGTRAIDNQLLKLNDIDFNFVAVNSGGPQQKNSLNPDRVLVRYKFLEMLVRLAIDKYFQSGQAKSVSDAVLRLLEEDGVLTRMDQQENQQKWRETRYWNMECDNFLKEKYELIQQMYERFAGSRTSDQKGFTSVQRMSASQFKDLVNCYDLYSENFVERDVGIAFNLSMMSQVDQITSDRHTQMQMVEFLEALARIAEKSSRVSPQQKKYSDFSLEERSDLPLDVKFRGLFYYVQNPNIQQQDMQTNDKKFVSGSVVLPLLTSGTRNMQGKNQTITSFMLMSNIGAQDQEGKQRQVSEQYSESRNSLNKTDFKDNQIDIPNDNRSKQTISSMSDEEIS